MPDRIRIGVIGASPRGSWGTRAHIPALQALPEYEIKAICTAHAETAAAAAEAFGAELAFHEPERMFAHPDIDLVAVCVKVPYHYELTMGALRAGKGVYCEWPLGANLVEAQEMAQLAQQQGVLNVVGLQGRADPTLNYVRELVAQGYIGKLLACNMTAFNAGVYTRTADRMWQGDPAMGANTLTISAGHSIDAMCYCLGEFGEVSSRLATTVPQWRASDTEQSFETRSPDNVLIAGVLQNGAMASVHVAAVPYNGSGWRLEVYGSDGTLFLNAGAQAQMGPSQVFGAKADAAPAELTVPDRFTIVPEGTPKGVSFNVAQAYTRLAQSLDADEKPQPDFAQAVQRHRLIEAMQHSAAEGRSVRVD